MKTLVGRSCSMTSALLAVAASLLLSTCRATSEPDSFGDSPAVAAFRALYPTVRIASVEQASFEGFNPYETWPRLVRIHGDAQSAEPEDSVWVVVTEEGLVIQSIEPVEPERLPARVRDAMQRAASDGPFKAVRCVTRALAEYVVQKTSESRVGVTVLDGAVRREMLFDADARLLRDTPDSESEDAPADDDGDQNAAGPEAKTPGGDVASGPQASDFESRQEPDDETTETVRRAIGDRVRSSFPGKPSPTIGTAHMDDGVGGRLLVCYTADFHSSGRFCETLFTANGELLHAVVHVKNEEVPATVRAAIEACHPGASIESAALVDAPARVRFAPLSKERSTYTCLFRDGKAAKVRNFAADGTPIGH